jgi:hypothetical protein
MLKRREKVSWMNEAKPRSGRGAIILSEADRNFGKGNPGHMHQPDKPYRNSQVLLARKLNLACKCGTAGLMGAAAQPGAMACSRDGSIPHVPLELGARKRPPNHSKP